MKLLWVQEEEQRKAGQTVLPESELPRLWILAATVTQPVLKAFKAETTEDWLPGMYSFGEGLQTQIIAIDQLPETEETLLLRILERYATQERAIREVLALPLTDPKRNGILQLLANWRVRIDIGEIADFTGREALMALSQAYLEWEERTREQGIEQGERSLIFRQLTRQVGNLPDSVRSQIETLPLHQLESLGEALLDFSVLSDLEQWLREHS